MKDKQVILVVDDQLQNIELLEAYLMPQGYEIIAATNGEDALGKLSGNQIDMILLDVQMPGIDGFEVIRRVRKDKLHWQLPIILVTALRETEDRVKGIEAGCDDFISKPVDKLELLARVRSLLKVKDYNDLLSTYRKELESEVTRRTDELTHALENLQQDIIERKQMEESLRASEKRYRHLFDASPDGIVVIGSDGRITSANNKQGQMYRYESPSEMIGVLATELVATSSREYSAQILQRRLNGEYIPPVEYALVRKDGTTFYGETSATTLGGADGTVSGYICVTRDTTDRKRAEEALEISNEKLKDLFDTAPVGYHEIDENGNIDAVNQTELNMLGYSYEEMIGQRVWEFNSDSEKSRQRVLNRLAGNIPSNKNSEQFYTHKDGTAISVLVDDLILRNKLGKISGIRTTILDVTTLNETKEALRETSDYLESLLSFANAPIMVWDNNNKITRFNLAFERLTGYTIDDILGKHPEILFPVEMREEFSVLLSRMSSGENLVSIEMPVRCKDGIVRTVLWNTANIYAADVKTIIATIANGQDITERNRAEQERNRLQGELIQVQKMDSLGTLAGGIAHDFNNILGIILAYTYMLEKRKENPEKFSESISAINQAVQRGTALVRQILTFARKSDGALEPMSLMELIHELLSMLDQTFPKIITFTEIVPKDLPNIDADRTQIHRALLNLCMNARDVMPHGGTITIKAEKQTKEQMKEQFPTADQDSYICISVSDTGEGMNEATRSKIFDPFFTTKPKGKGTGMGLPVVYGVVQAHQGFINVESELGHGTTFRLYFPIPNIIKKSTDSRQSEPFDVGGTETILIVEDEKLLIEMMHFLLVSKGYKVLIAHDGAEAIAVYKKHKKEIALVLTDMDLPMMSVSGIEEFKKLKEIDPGIKVIFISGFVEPAVKAELQNAGADGFLKKPFIADEILRLFRKVLDK